MDSNEIARNFYTSGRANTWLSQKQTSWLYTQACREAGRRLESHGTPIANGIFNLESGEAIGWEIAISPRNQCSIFATHSVTALMEKQNAEREAQIERGKEFVQTLKGSPFTDLYPPELIARMFNVAVKQVEEWFALESIPE